MPQTTALAQQCYIDLWETIEEKERDIQVDAADCAFGQACKEGFTKHLRQDKVIAAVSGGKKGTLLSGGEAGKDQSRVNARDLVNYSLFRVDSERWVAVCQ